jgi:hypothetical protein
MELTTVCPNCNTKFSITITMNTIIANVHCPNCNKEALVEDNDDEIEDESNYFIQWA